MDSIMDLATGLFRGETLDRLSSQLSESRTATERGISYALPVSLAGLAQQAQSETSAKDLLAGIRDGSFPSVEPNDFGQMLSDPSATKRVLQSSSGFLNGFFGNKLSTLIDMVTGPSGLSRSSATTLLGLAAPLLMSWLGKEVKAKGLDARGLSRLLADEGQKIKGQLPAGFETSFRSAGVIESARDRVGEGEYAARDAMHQARDKVGEWSGDLKQRASHVVEEGRAHRAAAGDHANGLRWLAAAGLVAFGALLLWWGFRRPVVEEVQVRAPDMQIDVTPPRATEKVRPPTEVARPVQRQAVAGKDVPVLRDNADALEAFFSGNAPVPQRFIIENLEFDTGSARVAPNAMLDAAARILGAHPNAMLRIEGHTDRQGKDEENQMLSQRRADAVRNYLLSKGVMATQMTAVGMSGLNPIAENETAAGRAQNRRVELIVTRR